MQTIGTFLNDLIILGVFIFLFLLVHRIIKLKSDKQTKIDKMIQKGGVFIKIVTYLGIILLIVTISLNVKKTIDNNKPWTEDEIKEMVKICLKNAKNLYAQDSLMAKDYCNCATEKFVTRYNREEAQKIDEDIYLSDDIATKLVNECLKEINNN